MHVFLFFVHDAIQDVFFIFNMWKSAIVSSCTLCHFSVLDDDKNYAGLITHCVIHIVFVVFLACLNYFVSTYCHLPTKALKGLHDIKTSRRY